MVETPRAKVRPGPDNDQLRPLYEAIPVRVLADKQQRPVALIDEGRRQRVEKIEDDWVIEDEWWRSPIHRIYYDVVLESGVRQTIFHDVVGGAWYQQDDPYPLAESLRP